MTINLPFWKLQSIGNDFPLVHMDDVRTALGLIRDQETPESETAALARLTVAICDRRFGVGGDGLLTLERGDGQGADVVLRMFNPDGTEDFCGNGIRCAAAHAHRLGWVGDTFVLRHRDKDVPIRIGDGRIKSVIGQADYTPDKVPVLGGPIFDGTVWSGMDSGAPLSLFGSALTTGSTHVVIPTQALPDDGSFASVSPKIETDPKFPIRTSVIWSQEVAPMHLKLRIWERGVGETMGCGTGSSAAAADYLRRRGKGGTVRVDNPGGTVYVTMSAWNAPIEVEGVAEAVYEGEFRFKV